jgi:NAD+--asparagine ADP-ribosyltransferase
VKGLNILQERKKVNLKLENTVILYLEAWGSSLNECYITHHITVLLKQTDTYSKLSENIEQFHLHFDLYVNKNGMLEVQ